jgi:hypothetical protein
MKMDCVEERRREEMSRRGAFLDVFALTVFS